MSSSDVENMKSSLTGWREILVMIHSVVTWEQVYGVWYSVLCYCGTVLRCYLGLRVILCFNCPERENTRTAAAPLSAT